MPAFSHNCTIAVLTPSPPPSAPAQLSSWKGIDRASVIAAESRTGGAFEHEDNRAATTEGARHRLRVCLHHSPIRNLRFLPVAQAY